MKMLLTNLQKINHMAILNNLAIYFSLVIFALICLYFLFVIVGYSLISLGERLRSKLLGKAKNQNNGGSLDNDNSKSSFKKPSLIVFVRNAYHGIYRVFVFKTGKIPVNWLRLFLYRHVFKMKIDEKVLIHKGLEIRDGYKITIGKGTIIGDDCLLDGRGGLSIGENVNFSSRVSVYTMQHDYKSKDFACVSACVTIGSRAWISCNSIVLPGVSIADNAVIAAGAVVSKSAEKSGLYAGVPARFLKERPTDLDYEFNGGGPWFL